MRTEPKAVQNEYAYRYNPNICVCVYIIQAKKVRWSNPIMFGNKRAHCTDHVKRGAFNVSGSGEEPGFYSPCQHERAAHRKYDANIEEIIADRGFGFHAKVK